MTLAPLNTIIKYLESLYDKYRPITAWHNFKELDQKVEKLSYPLEIGDEYDNNSANEVISQI